MAGCSSGPQYYFEEATPRVNRIARQQLPDDPVYNRLRWVHLPHTLPLEKPRVSEQRARLAPVYHLELLDNSLKQASVALASTARYTSHCSDLIADDTITLNALGTIDELASLIGEQAGIEVVVDHEHEEVRFLPLNAEQAEGGSA